MTLRKLLTAAAIPCIALSISPTVSRAADPKPATTTSAPAAPSSYAIPIGSAISLEAAKKAAAVAAAEAHKNNWHMAIAVVDPAGTLIYYEKMDTTQLGSAKIAIDKARSAALFKRPTKAFQDTLAGGGAGLRILGLEGAVPVEGGVPLLVEGKLVGAIGVSGDLSENDAKCANAAAATMK
jgi:glc operon protein GlcG